MPSRQPACIPTRLADWTADVRFATRLMWRQRWFAFAAIVTLSLAIGVSNTVYTVVNAMILRGLPVPHPDRIVMFTDGSPNSLVLSVSYRDVADWRAATASFDEIALFSSTTFTIGNDGRAPDVVGGSFVSANIFRVVEQPPLLGRDFNASDEQPGAAPVAVLGYSVWASRYASDPAIVGRTVRVNDRPTTIVGVMPPGFRFPLTDDLWMPASAMPNLQLDKRDVRPFRACGRLAASVPLSRARAEIAAVTERLAAEHAATNRTFRAALLPFTGTAANPMYLALLGAVGCVLLIACANVSNLLLARADGRSYEIAVRAALGASRWRVIRQFMIESLLLAVLAGVVGFVLSIAGVKAFAYAVQGINFPYWYRDRWTMDYTVGAFMCGVCFVSALVFGIAPAVHLARRDMQRALKQG